MIEAYSQIDMFGPIYGTNWFSPEIVNGLTFRWSNAISKSTLKLPTFNAPKLLFRYILAFHPQEHQLDQIVIDIDGIALDICWALQGPYCVLWGDVALTRRSSALCTITVPQVIASPDASDLRTIGIAVNSVEVMVLKSPP